jgi:plasmid stabilization system protein ParE
MSSYELSEDAAADLYEITDYTFENHGDAQTLKYIDTLDECASNLATGHGHYKELPELHLQLRMKHCQHHFIFGVVRESRPMLVVAILHERMKLIERVRKRLE